MSGATAPGGTASPLKARHNNTAGSVRVQLLATIFLLVALAIGWHWWRRDALVVYCAHDAIFAEDILRRFEEQSGLRVAVRYDTEATKSLGLVELLAREKDAPRCDVFWNNEVLGTIDLADRGVLAPYRGSGWERIPAAFKDADGRWAGFAARLRMIIVNTGHLPADEAAIRTRLAGDLSKAAIAKPLYGTTLTHYAVLWQRLGRDKLIAWHRDWRVRGGREANGNAGVKDLVANGTCDLGFTDTDDYFEAKDDGKAVAAVPVRLDDGATICIPNTVALVRGARHEAEARKLVDFLLSAETELALARSKSRQIPLGPVPEDQVPIEVRELRRFAVEGVPLANLSTARAECLAWLKEEYLR
jgi:iron(III) transport system substrate-binding protein